MISIICTIRLFKDCLIKHELQLNCQALTYREILSVCILRKLWVLWFVWSGLPLDLESFTTKLFLCFVSDRMFEEKNIDFIQRPEQSNNLLFVADIFVFMATKV